MVMPTGFFLLEIQRLCFPLAGRQAGTAPRAQSQLAPSSEGCGRKGERGQGAANSPTHNMANESRKQHNPGVWRAGEGRHQNGESQDG